MSHPNINPQQYRELAAAAITAEKTARRLYRGERCRPATYERLRRAAEQLGLPLPPKPEEHQKGAA